MADTLKDELTIDPLVRGYNGPGAANPGPGPMSDQEATDDLNTSYRTRNRTSMSGDEIAQAADPTEFNALDDGSQNNTADVKSHWLALCGRTTIDPFATANVELVISIFGSGSTTVSNLNAGRVESITRAVELGLGSVKSRDVGYARSS